MGACRRNLKPANLRSRSAYHSLRPASVMRRRKARARARLRKSRSTKIFPSPLAGEVGRERSERTGEGPRQPTPPRITAPPRPSPAALRAASSPARGEGFLECTRRSSRDLPGGAVLGVFEHDAHFGEFVTDAVGFFEVFCLTGGRARFDQINNFCFIDSDRGRPKRAPFGGTFLQQPNKSCTCLQASSRRFDALGRLDPQLVQGGERLRCIEVVRQRIERSSAQVSRRYCRPSAYTNDRESFAPRAMPRRSS